MQDTKNPNFVVTDETNLYRLYPRERRAMLPLLKGCASQLGALLSPDELLSLRRAYRRALTLETPVRTASGLPIARIAMQTLLLFAEQIEPDHNILLSIALYPVVSCGAVSADEVRSLWGNDVAYLLSGMEKVNRFDDSRLTANPENYRGLLLSLAEDIRVILIKIIRILTLMRSINHHPDDDWVRSVAFKANYLYAQLAHRMGLYKIKGELEDLALKYTNREIYSKIAAELSATKRAREAYIAAFIKPLKKKLEDAGLHFEIKGRTKSISSIWAKIKKQKVEMSGIYDLFAIRVIIDTPREREKADCWLAYSILADMYTANPARMKDWITLPKSNGYESLHATVMGPESKWVEVQFRTRRMDLTAEKGLAAHWRYKGVKSDATDQWMNNIRDILETAESGPMELMKNMKMAMYDKEVFAFTPKGDLFRLAAGSTVLDFAFAIHSNVGCRCMGAVVNGTHQKITYRIKSGDTVEVVTSPSQSPKQDWLQIVVSSKARNKIKQALNESRNRSAAMGKELLERRLRNRKLELEETLFSKTLKKLGYKTITDFYLALGTDALTPDKVIAKYNEIQNHESQGEVHIGADEYRIQENDGSENASRSSDILMIGDKNIKGLNYKLAKCCSPVYGDEVFGFISSDGVVKIHLKSCPNARNMRQRYPYRLIKVQWSGSTGDMLPVTLKVVGQDDIGIVTNLTSIIAKEPAAQLRNISIDSNDGLFQGYLVIGVKDNASLSALIRKLGTVKGVKEVTRS